jgi:hypothetical protein
MVQNPKVLCEVLLKAQRSDGLLSAKEMQGVPAELLQSVFPDKYGRLKVPETFRIANDVNATEQNVVLFSGGFGSGATLWKLVTRNATKTAVFLENMFPKPVDDARSECVKYVMTLARGTDGSLLVTGNPPQTMLSTAPAPKDAHLLPRRGRIALCIAVMHSATDPEGAKPVLVWGSVQDCTDVFYAMRDWGLRHACVYPDRVTALYSLSRAIALGHSYYEELYEGKLAPGACLPPDTLNNLCSCWQHEADTEVAYLLQPGEKEKPFEACCGSCAGCSRWYAALDRLYVAVPAINVLPAGTEDDRHFSNIPTARIKVAEVNGDGKLFLPDVVVDDADEDDDEKEKNPVEPEREEEESQSEDDGYDFENQDDEDADYQDDEYVEEPSDDSEPDEEAIDNLKKRKKRKKNDD